MEDIANKTMEDINKSTRPRYEVLLDQLVYIRDRADKKLNLSGNNKNDPMLDDATTDLGGVCMMLNDNGNYCPDGCRFEDGMCICG